MKTLNTNNSNIANDAVTELRDLRIDGLLDLHRIDWWLLKFYNSYKSIKKQIKNQYLFDLKEEWERLPDEIGNKNIEDIFLDLYDRLNNLSDFHKYEEYFKNQLIKYKSISVDRAKLKKWVMKSEQIVANNFVLFLLDYLDYNEDPIHLKVYVPDFLLFEIYVDQEDFKSIVEFLEIFNELYWVQEIVPESMERIRNEMKKLPFDDTYWDRVSENFNPNDLL